MVFKNPAIGAYLWAWFSIMNPHKLTYGFAWGLPFAQMIALTTLVAFLVTRKRQSLPLNSITLVWASLAFWLSVTSLFALNSSDVILARWIFVMKIHLMCMVSLMLVVEEKQLRNLVLVVAYSLAFYGIKGGIFTAATGGGYRVWGPDGMLGGNNELAVGLVMVVPFLYWHAETEHRRWLRRGAYVSIALCVLSILGTQSRGALLAVVGMAAFLGLKSKHPWRVSLLLLLGLPLAVMFMPDSWMQRMDTIEDFRADDSALSRLWTWTTLWNAALDRPLVGVGFHAETVAVFMRYAPTGGQWAIFSNFDRVWVAHSIYFQMLGEHGFVGLGLFLALWMTVWYRAGKLAVQAQAVPELADWLPLLLRMVQVSLIGYLIGGAFLSLANLDLPLYFMGYVVVAEIFVRRRLAAVPAMTSRPRIGQPAGMQA